VSSRSGLVLLLSLTFGGSAALGVNKYVTNKSGVSLLPMDSVSVVVAAQDIPRGASITADLLKTRDYPKGMLPPGTLARVGDALDRAVFVPLVKDEPLLEGKLAPKGAKRGMSALVPNGLRAFTIHTPSVASGVGGFILPGDKVDVLFTMDTKRDCLTTTLLQNLEILAVDQRIDAPADNRIDPKQLHSVTLLVTPDQTARLGLAQNKGSLHLALRNHKDDQLLRASRARLAELDDGFREAPLEVVTESKPSPLPCKVVTIYRGIRSVEQLRLGDVAARTVESVAREDSSKVDESR
jgi:pilus assembly protein CpaB